jgi:hypothetical protein
VNSTGTAALHVTNISFIGANSGDFSQTSTCTAAVNPSASCAITVSYKPGAAGTSNATLQIQDDAPSAMQTVAVSGTADDFALPVPGGSGATQTIARGGTATYALTLSSTNGFAGNVNLTCTTTAPSSKCNVTTPVTLTSKGTAPATVTVSPQVAGTTPPAIPFTDHLRPWRIVSLAILMFALVAYVRQQKQQKRMPRWRTVLALGSIALIVAGCSGGGGITTQPPPPGPPPGSYSVTVTASSGGRTLPPVNLTLVVQ